MRFWISTLALLFIFLEGTNAAGPLCYSCFHYSRATDGETVEEAFRRDFGRLAPSIMAVFKNTGTIDSSTVSQEACRNGSTTMAARRCATGQKCLEYTHAWKSSYYTSQATRKQWVMTWRDCVDATFDCDSSPMDTLDSNCCVADRCNSNRYNADALLANAKK